MNDDNKNDIFDIDVGNANVNRLYKRYNKPEEFLNAGVEYIEKCQELDRIPNISGLHLHLQITDEMYYRLCKDIQFSSVVKIIEKMIEDTLINTHKNKFSDAMKIFYFKNKFGYVDKIEHENKNLNVNLDSVEDLEMLLSNAKQKKLTGDVIDVKTLPLACNKASLKEKENHGPGKSKIKNKRKKS